MIWNSQRFLAVDPLSSSVEKKQMQFLQPTPGIAVFIPALFVVIGIALYAGCQFLIIGLYRRRDPVFLVFGSMCLIGIGYVAAQTQVYQATTAAGMVAALRQRAAVTCIFYPLFLTFVVLYTKWRAMQRWLIPTSVLFAGFLVLDLILPYGIRLSGLTSIESISLPWGETIRLYRGPPGKWDLPYASARILVFALTSWRAIALLRTTERKRARILCAYCMLQFAALLHGALVVDLLGYRLPYVDEFAYLALVLIMSFRLGSELHSQTLASERAVIELEQQISERKQVEQALRTSEDRFRQSQKMEAIGRLAGGIAHDFNNLLTAIIGYGQLLLTSVRSEPARTYAVEVDKAGQRASSLTRQLLAFSRNQVLQPTTLNLNGVVVNLNTMLRRLIREDIELITVLSPQLGDVSADPGQIDQVVINLVVNASDAMPVGGKLTIETASIGIDEPSAPEHIGLAPGRYIMLAMTDTGDGMDSETKSRIFEPFFTTKKVGRGTGLGLSTVYGIVKQSGGQIFVQSEPGHGTTFRVYLPQVSGTAGPMGLEPRVAAESLRGSETILLVEDEDAVRDLARRALEEFGYRVVSACSGNEALDICGRQNAVPDLLVTDVVMPHMSGPELAKAVTALCPEVRVLYISGYVGDAFSSREMEPGSDLLPKPFTPERLARKVREVLSTHNG